MEKIAQEVKTFKDVEQLVAEKYTSSVINYSPQWIEDFVHCAYSNLGPHAGVQRPHLLTLALFGGKVSEHDFFVLEKRSAWKLSCFVFSDNKKMEEWISAIGEDKVIHKIVV